MLLTVLRQVDFDAQNERQVSVSHAGYIRTLWRSGILSQKA